MIKKFEVENDKSILLVGPIVWSEGMRPVRMVMRDLVDDKQFTTHREYMTLRVDVVNFSATWVHEAFGEGHYFDYGSHHGEFTYDGARTEAEKDFHERKAKR